MQAFLRQLIMIYNSNFLKKISKCGSWPDNYSSVLRLTVLSLCPYPLYYRPTPLQQVCNKS